MTWILFYFFLFVLSFFFSPSSRVCTFKLSQVKSSHLKSIESNRIARSSMNEVVVSVGCVSLLCVDIDVRNLG